MPRSRSRTIFRSGSTVLGRVQREVDSAGGRTSTGSSDPPTGIGSVMPESTVHTSAGEMPIPHNVQ